MRQEDRLKYERLVHTFEMNFRITKMYALYLERFPELITREMVDTLTEDGFLTREEAIVAIISEAFGIDMERGEDDKELIRAYLTPSVRMLDPKRYTENPYYKNIKISNIKEGNWEYREESYPAYRAVIAHDMMFPGVWREVPPLGFFPEEFRFPAVLEDDNEWMTLTPVDLDTSDEAIEAAHGNVITFGLGLGYYAYMCQRKPEVLGITVVERSADVINLFKKYILPQFEHPEKVRIIEDDAFLYAEEKMPYEINDLAFVDTWRDASDGYPMYERMKPLERLSPNTKFMYWIENFLISRGRAIRFAEEIDKIEAGDLGAADTYAELAERIEGKSREII